MFIEQDKEQQIASIVDDMDRMFEGRASRDAIEAVVRNEYERLCNEAKIDSFVPILVRRRIKERLAA